MKKIKWLILFMPLVGCSFIISSIYGIKDDCYESESTQKEFLNSKNVDTNYLAFLKTGYFDSLSTPSFCLDTSTSPDFTPIQFRVYDSSGKFFSGWELCFGNASKSGIYKDFPHKSPGWWPINEQLTLGNDLSFIQPINFNLDDLKAAVAGNKYDYVVISMWAGYLGKLSTNMLRELDKATLYNNRILHIKVNLSTE